MCMAKQGIRVEFSVVQVPLSLMIVLDLIQGYLTLGKQASYFSIDHEYYFSHHNF